MIYKIGPSCIPFIIFFLAHLNIGNYVMALVLLYRMDLHWPKKDPQMDPRGTLMKKSLPGSQNGPI